MATPEQQAIGKLDGRNPDTPDYAPLGWVGVTLYQEWSFGKDWVNRPKGSDPNGEANFGGLWWSPSSIDHTTVLSEILTKKYHGCTVLHMIAALFAIRVEGHDAADVRKALGLPDVPLPLDEPGLGNE